MTGAVQLGSLHHHLPFIILLDQILQAADHLIKPVVQIPEFILLIMLDMNIKHAPFHLAETATSRSSG